MSCRVCSISSLRTWTYKLILYIVHPIPPANSSESTVTWDQAQFELFSYILSKGYRYVSPCPPVCYLQSETKIEPDLRLNQQAPTIFGIQLFWERLLEKNLPQQPRNVIWDMITTLFLTLYSRISFCCFPLTLANTCPWTLAPFFQISLKNNELTTTHNTFRVCRVHFFRQPFSK